jgi:two-component system, OmpR family, alkaline phosphatase synthesis response regulator PhoP
MTMPRILVVEDEAHLATGIKFNLELEGYEVDVIDDGGEALRRLAPAPSPASGSNGWDLVLLDVMLPSLDGFQVVDRMRAAGNFTPVLMLTAKSLPEDLVQGLEAGADDYLPKPFDLTVLLARVKGLLRRRDWARGSLEGPPGEGGPGALPLSARVGEAEIDFRNFEVKTRGQTVRLTLLEAMLLKLLVQNAGQVVSKAEILEKVWNVSPDTETRAVDNFIVRLRRVLEPNPRFPKYLHTVRGAGYKLLVD